MRKQVQPVETSRARTWLPKPRVEEMPSKQELALLWYLELVCSTKLGVVFIFFNFHFILECLIADMRVSFGVEPK